MQTIIQYSWIYYFHTKNWKKNKTKQKNQHFFDGLHSMQGLSLVALIMDFYLYGRQDIFGGLTH